MTGLSKKNAQTALELAVFGAILIFILGTIINSAVSRSNQVQSMFRATRMALALSHQTTETKRVSGRNVASILMVEDRLAAASSKYGAVDRVPLMMQGSAMHTANLMMPADYGDSEDLPVFDMFINGKHFVFSTAAYKTVEVATCAEPPGGGDVCFPGRYVTNCTSRLNSGQSMFWDDECLAILRETTQLLACSAVPATENCPLACLFGCTADDLGLYQVTTITPDPERIVGCAKFYTIVDNHPLIPEWCESDTTGRMCNMPNPLTATGEPAIPPLLPGDPVPPCINGDQQGCNLSADERFDLDRNGSPDVTEDRSSFAWQWYLVMGVEEAKRKEIQEREHSLIGRIEDALSIERPTLIKAEGVVLPGGEEDAKNTALDVDCDLKLEFIQMNVQDGDASQRPNRVSRDGIIKQIGVQDMQEGDIDTTYDTSDENNDIALYGVKRPFGFTKDVRLYAFVRGEGSGGGTYFRVDEGNLFNTGGQFIRTVSKKDQVDLIERVWQLSHNTGRYCLGAEPTDWGSRENNFTDADGTTFYDITAGERLLGLENPVEVCESSEAGCMSNENIESTCMDTANLRIYIRSRIQDLHGRKWVTDVGEDPYVNFTVPPVQSGGDIPDLPLGG